jgi:hypothetical protein
MIGDSPEQSLNRITWGDFVPLLEAHGVILAVLPVEVSSSRGIKVPGFHLVRRAGGRALFFPLPLSYQPENRVGIVVVYNVCRRLEIEPHFPGWPVVL